MTTKKMLAICGITLLALIIIDIFAIGPGAHSAGADAHSWWHGFIGFDAIFGILGCLLTIWFSKSLGKLFIRRKEDYYKEDGDNND